MKKRNAKVESIKLKKREKRNASDRERNKRKQEKLNMKANKIESYKKAMFDKYLEMLNKQLGE